MNYYYDILLNFQEKYYWFYEWDQNDNIDFIKKIPIFHVDSKTYIELITKKISLNKEFLNSIENKTKLKSNVYLKYTCIFSDGKNSIALEFNDEGISINKSSLMLEDELNINEFMYTINLTKLDYSVLQNEELNNDTRQEINIKRLLKVEIDSMYQKKEYSKLKYIYLEWFNELSDNIETMYNDMLKKIDNNLSEKEYEIYELIKLSYNNV